MKYFMVLSFVSILAVSCSNGNFSKQEKDKIGTSPDKIMPLYTVENRSDSSFLRLESKPLTRRQIKSEWFNTLVKRMSATVTNPQNEGVGIAAPQVGLNYRLIVVQRFDKPSEPFEYYVNPSIVGLSEQKSTGSEGCLSVPGYYGQVERSDSIEIEYIDPETFGTKRERVEGFTAVIFQHETDHLDGILYIDRAKTIEAE